MGASVKAEGIRNRAWTNSPNGGQGGGVEGRIDRGGIKGDKGK